MSVRSPARLAGPRALDVDVPGALGLRRGARVVVALFVALLVALAALPWQQTAPASGEVIAWDPAGRVRRIEAPVDGRVAAWHVVEGQEVTEGDLLASVRDNDPERLERLQGELAALDTRIEAQERMITVMEAQLEAVRAERAASVASAQAKVTSAEAKVLAAVQAIEAAQAEGEAAGAQRGRVDGLASQGLRSEQDRENAALREARAQAEVDRARANRRGAEAEREAAARETEKVAQAGDAKISETLAKLADASAKLASLQAERLKLTSQVVRQGNQELRAPVSGRIVRLYGGPNAEQVKTGDVLAEVLPEVWEPAVALTVTGNDAALVVPGQRVRLQLEGWPALQFSGWPSVAMGTFGGEVAFVDPLDDGAGKFRVLVRPDPHDQPWPSAPTLRQGVRAKGWVLLDTVSLGYEAWRQINGFPPTSAEAAAKVEDPVLKAVKKGAKR